jgi:protein-tyrosine-phosphatase
MTAEYAVRRALSLPGRCHVSSAGTEDSPLVVWPVVAEYLKQHGLDVGAHRRRTLTRTLLDEADLVVAMSTEHQRELVDRFSLRAPLYTELAGYPGEALPDVDEAVPDYITNHEARTAHVRRTIDRIVALAPAFAARLGDTFR